jgi:hypothetical protein
MATVGTVLHSASNTCMDTAGHERPIGTTYASPSTKATHRQGEARSITLDHKAYERMVHSDELQQYTHYAFRAYSQLNPAHLIRLTRRRLIVLLPHDIKSQ